MVWRRNDGHDVHQLMIISYHGALLRVGAADTAYESAARARFRENHFCNQPFIPDLPLSPHPLRLQPFLHPYTAVEKPL
jgi:hypothetical protein